MKMRRGHTVPLSCQAFEVLAEAARLQRSDSLIFALRGSHGAARPPSQRTVSDALRQLGRVDADGRPITVHGFRTTLRVWQMECVPGSSEAAEIALAHEESDTTKKAYARSPLDEPRAKLMQQWADYVQPAADGSGGGLVVYRCGGGGGRSHGRSPLRRVQAAVNLRAVALLIFPPLVALEPAGFLYPRIELSFPGPHRPVSLACPYRSPVVRRLCWRPHTVAGRRLQPELAFVGCAYRSA